MKSRRLLFTILVLCSVAFVSCASAQDVSNNKAPEAGVVLTKLSPPVYPPLARQARITGDVQVRIGIQFGTVVSAEVISGPPMLKHAALESAVRTTYECRGCSGEITSYLLTYTFGFREDAGADCGYPRHLRSAKCLYLWKCGAWQSTPLRPPLVRQVEGHITILDDAACLETTETTVR